VKKDTYSTEPARPPQPRNESIEAAAWLATLARRFVNERANAKEIAEAYAAFLAVAAPAAARASGDSATTERPETEESIAADCYSNIAETMGTLNGYSVQEHVQTMRETMQRCSDFLHDFSGSSEGGDDQAVKLAADVRNCLNGRIDLVSIDHES
jgi:hypothetical protein